MRLHPHHQISSSEYLQIFIAFLEKTRVLLDPPGHHGSHNRLLFLHLRSFYSHCQSSQSRVPLAPSLLCIRQTSLHCCGLFFSSPGLCFSPGWRCPEALLMVFKLDSKRCKGVYRVDLGESFHMIAIHMSINLQNLASIQPRTSLVKFSRSPCTDSPNYPTKTA